VEIPPKVLKLKMYNKYVVYELIYEFQEVT